MIETKPPILQRISRNCLQFRKGLSKFLVCLNAFVLVKESSIDPWNLGMNLQMDL